MFFYIISFFALVAYSSESVENAFKQHEVRIGWGDMLFETVAFYYRKSNTWVDKLSYPDNYTYSALHHHSYTGYLFADYHYNVLRWLEVGGQVDFEGIFWQETTYNNQHMPISDTKYINNYNLVFMPTIRFVWYHSQWVNLYSGLAVGVNIAFDNQHKVKCAPAFNLNLIGMMAGGKH
ncbi:MAG: hypothetical protein IJ834_04135 [Paludibacteraceae bacterium]|nr:hypothetical protein [Paludibacteraceae bacterium]